jgi:hypothetical protein
MTSINPHTFPTTTHLTPKATQARTTKRKQRNDELEAKHFQTTKEETESKTFVEAHKQQSQNNTFFFLFFFFFRQ